MKDSTNKKECSVCGRMLPLSAFGADKSKKDGLRAMCKECRAPRLVTYRQSTGGKIVEERRNRNRRLRGETDEEYARNRRAIVRKSSARPEYREALRQKDRTEEGRLRKRAMGKVERAIKRGEIIRPSRCQECNQDPGCDVRGRTKVRAYHHNGHDEDHQLDVLFLCARCLNRRNAVKR